MPLPPPPRKSKPQRVISGPSTDPRTWDQIQSTYLLWRAYYRSRLPATITVTFDCEDAFLKDLSDMPEWQRLVNEKESTIEVEGGQFYVKLGGWRRAAIPREVFHTVSNRDGNGGTTAVFDDCFLEVFRKAQAVLNPDTHGMPLKLDYKVLEGDEAQSRQRIDAVVRKNDIDTKKWPRLAGNDTPEEYETNCRRCYGWGFLETVNEGGSVVGRVTCDVCAGSGRQEERPPPPRFPYAGGGTGYHPRPPGY
jgi:hypothetical protein